MKTLVCLILFVAAAMILWPSPKSTEPALPVSQPVAVQQLPASTPANVGRTTTSALPSARIYDRDQVMILHGQVLKSIAAGIVVQCMGLETASANGGSAADADRQKYGPLMICERGQWRPADWLPESRVDSTVTIVDALPPNLITPDSGVNLIVAPIGENTYTTHYEVGPLKPGGWMWKKRDNPLDMGTKPPQ